ncbi:glycoside hydrolase family 20 protein [Aaosphaeria arxii CBS 175.79]|uniref:beta-N-acetylhexosaminidase n=1 Tax=Aaosphaeria arxii CBS 175.79 TaxID=1450172 RepID=A0A6A5XNH7_9PLEO|nr:glycoside hydrolase family 20 protein [Aaosphaeria arxii CBS 175.79]KAF2014815.1 glycoside hydrolase family 20 protein [Aaosphaeria arxii CBS 175.79]
MWIRCLAAFAGVAAALQPLPPIKWTSNNTSSTGFSLSNAPKTIYLDSAFADRTDTTGLTLIPPTAKEFAETFRSDLEQLFGTGWTVEVVDNLPSTGILLGSFKGDTSEVKYENGVETEEGYELEISADSIFIGGTGSRGMFWGTRTLLQELLIAKGSSLTPGRVIDAPAYRTRGYMLDAGRKWYTPEFLKELCTYASFFKISEFHYHSSDNYPLNRGHNETWNKVFSHFSLYPEDENLQGIIERKNETLSREDFEDFQRHCAQRGVTVIPEIEAPGHCLAITKWKPELALPKKDLLNLSHPESIPTVKALWAEFLPWFQTKEVHIGADEYDSKLADVYINFVNEMSDWVNTTSGKRIRIWGTNEPSENFTVSTDITIQHWQYGESDPVKLQDEGYPLINSEDWWAYMSLKNDHTPILPATYPQFYNVTRTLNFANEQGWQWDPSLFNFVNKTEQLEPGASGNRGAILAAWSDNGPDATTQLEGYYAMRDGIPVVAARSWSGRRGVNITASTLASTLELLIPKAPGQNLERRFTDLQSPSKATPLLSWSSNSSNAQSTSLGKGSYGPPYTLSINATSPFNLTGPDTSLSIQTVTTNETSVTSLVFTTADNFPYPLRSTSESDGHDPGHPGRIWSNVSSSTHAPVAIEFPAQIRIETDVVNGSRVWVGGAYAGRFEVFVFGGRNTLFSWSQMALVAPVDGVEGGVEGLVLEAGTGGRGLLSGGEGGNYTGPYPNSSVRVGQSWCWTFVVALVASVFVVM